MKRQRLSHEQSAVSGAPPRVSLDVGGTKFSTTRLTLERSTYLSGLIDMSVWADDPAHVAEIFVDRDPTLFAHLLRLMRQVPLVAGLLPRDDHSLFAALLAEADFFGFDALLRHVKARAYYHVRDKARDYPKMSSFLPWMASGDGEQAPQDSNERREAFVAARTKRHEAIARIDRAYETRDEDYGADRFDEIYGSVAEALASDVLPEGYFSPPKTSKRIVQLLPVESATWLCIGDAYDDKYTVVEGARYPEDDQMLPMREMVERPGLVRRVACHALLEDERSERWIEPMVYVHADDQEEWMNHQPHDGCIMSRDNTLTDATVTEQTGGIARRMLLFNDYLDLIFRKPALFGVDGPRECWTHLLVRDHPPPEFGFKRSILTAEHEQQQQQE